MPEKVITFETDAKKDILEMFGVTVNADGELVMKKKPDEKILDPDGEPLKFENFAAIKKGSLVFVKSDIISLINLADTLKG